MIESHKRTWRWLLPPLLAGAAALLIVRARSPQGDETSSPRTSDLEGTASKGSASSSSSGVISASERTPASPVMGTEEQKKREAEALDTVSIRGLVKTYTEALQRKDVRSSALFKDAIRAKGLLAKKVMLDLLQEGRIPERFQDQIKRDCDEIN